MIETLTDTRYDDKEHSSLMQDISLCEWKLKALKQEIGNTEKVQKILEEERTGADIPKLTKERVRSTSL